MPTNRPQWSEALSTLPRWDCPTCGKGRLNLPADAFIQKETGPSEKIHDHPAWEPEWITKRFVAILKCDYVACEELVAVCGSAAPSEFIDVDDYGAEFQDFKDILSVYAIFPAPLPFRPISGTPPSVKAAIAAASSLVWQSSEASANKIRQAVQHLMNARKVKKIQIKNGKQSHLKLHDRIVEFAKSDAENGAILLAIKWVGNGGSHTDSLTRDSVLDAFDMLELVLDNLYGTTKAMIMKKVKAINKKKGPA